VLLLHIEVGVLKVVSWRKVGEGGVNDCVWLIKLAAIIIDDFILMYSIYRRVLDVYRPSIGFE